MLEFRSAIVNELGEIICWCSELDKDEVDIVLAEHPEWKKQCEVCYW